MNAGKTDLRGYALLVVDVQRGFDDPWWGRRNNHACDQNIDALVRRWTSEQRPVVLVQHDSQNPDSPLHPDAPGHALKPFLQGLVPALRVSKKVNSSFHGTPDLNAWLRTEEVSGIVVCGITTNLCCETTARVGGNLGYDVLYALDATHTFDRASPEGDLVTADELAKVTATNLHGEFATVVTTAQLLS